MSGHPLPGAAGRPNTGTIGLESFSARGAFALLGTVQVVLIFTITLLTVPLPVIGAEFGVGRSELVLLSAAYGLSFSGLLLLGGRLTDRYGPRSVLAIGLAAVAVGSATAAASPDFAVLLAARFGQGAGAALAAPAALRALLTTLADARERTKAMATWGGLSVLGASAGTLASGIATTWLSWRWMFAVPLLVSASVLLLLRRLPKTDPPAAGPLLDVTGAVLVTGGISVLSYGVVLAGEHGWSSAVTLRSVAAGVALLAAFTVREARCSDPLLPLSYLADRRRITALAAIGLTATGTAVVYLFLGLYLQQVRGWSPLHTSLALIPYAAALLVTSRLAGRLVTHAGAWPVVRVGLLLVAAGLGLLSTLRPQTSYLLGLLPGTLLMPIGAALAFASATVLAIADTPLRHAGLGGGVMNTAMELGPTLGLALLAMAAAFRTSARASSGTAAPVAATSGYAFAFGVGAVAFALLAGLTAFVRPTHRSR